MNYSRPAVNSTIVGEKFAMVWNSSASMLEIWVCSLAFNRVQVVVSDENLNLRLIPLIVIASSLLFQLCFSTVRGKEAAESESLNLYLCNKKDCKRIYEWPCKKSRVSWTWRAKEISPPVGPVTSTDHKIERSFAFLLFNFDAFTFRRTSLSGHRQRHSLSRSSLEPVY